MLVAGLLVVAAGPIALLAPEGEAPAARARTVARAPSDPARRPALSSPPAASPAAAQVLAGVVPAPSAEVLLASSASPPPAGRARPETGRVAFTVTGPGGALLDAEVRLLAPPGARAAEPVRSLAGGCELDPGRWTAVAMAEGYAARRVALAIEPRGDHQLELRLDPERVVVLSGLDVELAAGAIVLGPPGAQLAASRLGLLELRGLGPDAEAEVLLRRRDGTLARAAISGPTARAVDEASACLEGFVVGARAEVTVIVELEAASGREQCVSIWSDGASLVRREALTGAGGHFRVDDLPAGTWRVRLEAGGAGAAVRLRPGETRPVLIRP